MRIRHIIPGLLALASLGGCVPYVATGHDTTYFTYAPEDIKALPEEPSGMEQATTAQLASWDNRLMDVVRTEKFGPPEAARLYAAVAIAQHDALRLRAHAAGVDNVSALVTCHLVEDTCDRMTPFIQNEEYNMTIADMVTKKIQKQVRYAPPTVGATPPDGRQMIWNVGKAVTPDAGTWPRWGSGAEVGTPAPPAPGTATMTGQLKSTSSVTRAMSPQQMHRMMYWNTGEGTETSAGLWLGYAQSLLVSHAVSNPMKAAQIRATLTAAMADATLNTWKSKFTHWTQVPNQLDTYIYVSGMGGVPAYPTYPSELAAVSEAAAIVLGTAFPDSMDETLARSREAAQSPIWAGSNLPSDSFEGLRLGKETAARILADPRFAIGEGY